MVVIASPVNTGRGNLSELNCSITAYNFQTIYFHVNTKTFMAIAIEHRYRDHALNVKWIGFCDCHIEPDWILIYRLENNYLYLERTGSHSDLFR